MHNGLLYHLGKLWVPRDERVDVIRKAHTSLISIHFGVGKIVAQLQIYCYWPKMNEIVSKYIKGCVLYSTGNPSNRKLGLYTPLLVPLQPWESVFMHFVEGFPMSRVGHDYLYVVMDRFNKMCILIPCKKQVTYEQTTQMLFDIGWVHFGFPTSVISN